MAGKSGDNEQESFRPEELTSSNHRTSASTWSVKLTLTGRITWILILQHVISSCQRRRRRGRLGQGGNSLVWFRFKVLNWPFINTSHGAKAVIFENNLQIVLLHSHRLCPWANTNNSQVQENNWRIQCKTVEPTLKQQQQSYEEGEMDIREHVGTPGTIRHELRKKIQQKASDEYYWKLQRLFTRLKKWKCSIFHKVKHKKSRKIQIKKEKWNSVQHKCLIWPSRLGAGEISHQKNSISSLAGCSLKHQKHSMRLKGGWRDMLATGHI